MTARFVFAMILLLSTTTAGVAGIRGELDPVNHAGRQPSAMCGDRFREVKVAGPLKELIDAILKVVVKSGRGASRGADDAIEGGMARQLDDALEKGGSEGDSSLDAGLRAWARRCHREREEHRDSCLDRYSGEDESPGNEVE